MSTSDGIEMMQLGAMEIRRVYDKFLPRIQARDGKIIML